MNPRRSPSPSSIPGNSRGQECGRAGSPRSGRDFLAIALVIVTPWLGRLHSEQILRDRFSIFLHDEGKGYLAREQDRTFKDLPAAIPYLVNFGSITVLDLTDCEQLTNVDGLKELKAYFMRHFLLRDRTSEKLAEANVKG
jgi:hypothetical protein